MIANAVKRVGDAVSEGRNFSLGKDRWTRFALSALGVILFVVLWEAVISGFGLNTRYFPSPTTTWTELQRIWQPVLTVLPKTLQAAGVGYLLALALSIAVAIPLVASDRVLNAIMPFIIGINTVPRVAMTPLVIYWVGFMGGVPQATANYILALWVAFFPMLIAAIDGFRSIDESTENMLALYGATTFQEFRYVRFKSGLPFIFDGMKIGFILAVIGAVVGEFVSGTAGIGSMAYSAISRTAVSRAVVIVLVLGVISTAIVLAIYVLESKMIHWRESSIMGE
jgi:NitT/TauT family transport system permease protein